MKTFALSLIVAASFAVASAEPPEFITRSSSGGIYAATKGKTFVIELDGNPSTGYSWNLEGKPKLVKLVSSKTVSVNNKPGIVGAPAKYRFTFQSLKTGIEKVTLRYYRVWEKKKDSDKTWTATFKIMPSAKAIQPVKPAKK